MGGGATWDVASRHGPVGSGAPVDGLGRAVGAPAPGVDRPLQVAAELGMGPPEAGDRAADPRGHGLAGPLDRVADAPGPATEPEVAGDGLGQLLALLAGDGGALAVPGRLGVRLLVVELAQALADLASGPLVEGGGAPD